MNKQFRISKNRARYDSLNPNGDKDMLEIKEEDDTVTIAEDNV